MKVVSFNINGIRARFHQLEELRDTLAPDIIGLQEIKVDDPQFPEETIREMGYHPYYFGQKGHYGVGFLTREPLENVRYGFPSDEEDAQRRMIIATARMADGSALTLLNGYFPQGENRNHEVKFPAKEKFYQDLQNYLEQHHSPNDQLIVMGDFNISHQDIDIGIGENNRKRWLRDGKCSFLPEERQWFDRLLGWGLSDSWRIQNPDMDDRFSWFDYRSKGFQDDPKRGLRIDTLLITEPLKQKLDNTGIDYHLRGMEKPSDHCPVWASFR